jgi:hypothetical protein
MVFSRCINDKYLISNSQNRSVGYCFKLEEIQEGARARQTRRKAITLGHMLCWEIVQESQQGQAVTLVRTPPDSPTCALEVPPPATLLGLLRLDRHVPRHPVLHS